MTSLRRGRVFWLFAFVACSSGGGGSFLTDGGTLDGATQPGKDGGSASDAGTKSDANNPNEGGTSDTGAADSGVTETCRTVGTDWSATAMLVNGTCANHGLAVDANGFAHVVFVTGSDAAGTAIANYATNKSGSFVSEIIDPAQGRVRSTAIAVDAAGHVHISYDKITGSTVRHATNATGSWIVEQVASAPLGGAGSNMTLDSNGVPNVTHKTSSTTLRLSVPPSDGGLWTYETVSTSGSTAASPWIDTDGTKHVAFYDGSPDTMFLASRHTSGTWNVSTIGAGRGPSLVRASDGKLHVSYLEVPTSGAILHHTVESSPGQWTASQVDSTTKYMIASVSSAVSSSSLIVAYEIATQFLNGCGIQVARLPAGGSTFTIERVIEVARTPQIAVDGTGKIHMTFCKGNGLHYVKEP